mmetsp:Transcript_14930/g.38698  ORF Transcript_14930/g.38698 Transcript_14930/m.38698 type:complete len:83 (+) Transcript_14930:1-249(+)
MKVLKGEGVFEVMDWMASAAALTSKAETDKDRLEVAHARSDSKTQSRGERMRRTMTGLARILDPRAPVASRWLMNKAGSCGF